MKVRRALGVARGRLAPAYAYADLLHDPARAVVVLGSRRSGTTKVAEALASARTTRFIFEPMVKPQSKYVPPGFTPGGYRAADADDPALLAVWQRVLEGRVRQQWLDKRNRSHLPTHRVVKCVVGNNLYPWLRHHFPQTPIVFEHRHPMAVAASIETLRQTAKGWSAHGARDTVPGWLEKTGLLQGPLVDRADDIRRMARDLRTDVESDVLRWCVENVLPLTRPPESGFLAIRFEDFVDDPVAVLTRVGEFAGLDVSRGLRDVDRPSTTDWGKGLPGRDGSRASRRDGWRERLDPDDQARGRAILEAFGLEDLVAG